LLTTLNSHNIEMISDCWEGLGYTRINIMRTYHFVALLLILL